jgi:arylsulfatase A-like enzyme
MPPFRSEKNTNWKGAYSVPAIVQAHVRSEEKGRVLCSES